VIGATKPRTALFAAYLDATRTEVRIVHAFPDAAAMTAHFVGSEERGSAADGLLAPAGFEVLGTAPRGAVDQLRRDATTAGVGLEVLARPLGGFLRAPA
jgi:hypothetical protein